MKVKSYFLILLSLGIGISCKTKKHVGGVIPTQEMPKNIQSDSRETLFKQVISQKNSTAAFTFSSELEYKDDKQSATLNMEVSVKQNQYIFINAKAFGIVNVARVMIQPDSIRILDLINRKYISASYRYMQSFSGVQMGFEQLQNLVFANACYDPTLSQTRIDSLQNYLFLVSTIGNTIQRVSYSKELKTEGVSLNEQGKGRELQVKFNDFRDVNGMRYPYNILINIQGEKKVDCKFIINNFATEIKKEPSFVVPKSYKVQVY